MVDINQFNSLNYKTDKFDHGYWGPYLTHFQDKRLNVKTLCEIGVLKGESLRLWKDFFPNAQIYGIDVDAECKNINISGIEILIGDQKDTEFLNTVINRVSEFDIIIDDGDHNPMSQRTAFKKLFPRMNKGGIYVIEDIGPCIDPYFNIKKDIDDAISNIMYWPPDLPAKDWRLLNLKERYSGIALYPFIMFVIK